jgi:hypothetical protein
MKISGLVLLSLFASFTACADLDQLARTEKAIPITFHNSGAQVMDSGAMYLWPPYSSAAVVDKKGNRCILAASGAKTINATSEGAFKLGKALEKIEGLDASVKNTLVESFTKISSADAKAAFVDIALFHLCILEQNGTFKSEDPARRDLVLQAYLATIEAITRSAPDAEAKPISLKAP